MIGVLFKYLRLTYFGVNKSYLLVFKEENNVSRENNLFVYLIEMTVS